MRRIFTYTCFALYFVLATQVEAQSIAQVSIGNYSRTNALYLNPALHGAVKLRWQLHLGGFWLNANNNYLKLKVPYSLYRLPGNAPLPYRTESGNPVFRNEWLQERINGRVKHGSISADVYGPAFSMGYKTWNFALFSSASAALRVNDVPEALAHALFKSLDSAQGAFSLYDKDANGVFNSGSFSASGNSRLGYGINAAKAIKLERNSMLIVGLSLKRVLGMRGFYIENNGISLSQAGNDSFRLMPGTMQFISYEDNSGRGNGADIGATLLLHKKASRRNGNYAKTRTQYFMKLGVSVMDIGRIRYSNAAFRTYTLRDTFVNGSGFAGSADPLKTLDSFFAAAGDVNSRNGTLYTGLPMRMVLSNDMQFMRRVFVSAIWSQSLRKRNSVHARTQSFFMLSPRLEYRYFEVSLPIMLVYDYRAVRAGLSLRFGPFYLGSNSIGSFIRTRSVSDADVFAGIAISELPFFKHSGNGQNGRRNSGNAGMHCAEF